MFGQLPSAREAPLTLGEGYVLAEIAANGVHFQVLGCSSAVRRLEWKGRVKIGPDFIVRTTEAHNAIFGGK